MNADSTALSLYRSKVVPFATFQTFAKLDIAQIIIIFTPYLVLRPARSLLAAGCSLLG